VGSGRFKPRTVSLLSHDDDDDYDDDDTRVHLVGIDFVITLGSE